MFVMYSMAPNLDNLGYKLQSKEIWLYDNTLSENSFTMRLF